jgi:hypothetical protein
MCRNLPCSAAVGRKVQLWAIHDGTVRLDAHSQYQNTETMCRITLKHNDKMMWRRAETTNEATQEATDTKARRAERHQV